MILLAILTGEGASGALVAGGGFLVVGYGIWSAVREKITQDAYKREKAAVARLDDTMAELGVLKSERLELQARVAYCEKHHGPPAR